MGQVKEMFLQQKEQVDFLKRELKDRYRGKGEFEDLVFVTTMGSPLIRHNAEKTINKVVDSINTKEAYEAKREQREPVLFERVYPHALRHTFASICYAAKMDVKTTQKLMGHAKISTTMDIYTHLDETFLEDDITKFNWVEWFLSMMKKRIGKMSKSMGYHSGMQHVLSLIMIESSFMMRNTAMMRIVMIR